VDLAVNNKRLAWLELKTLHSAKMHSTLLLIRRIPLSLTQKIYTHFLYYVLTSIRRQTL